MSRDSLTHNPFQKIGTVVVERGPRKGTSGVSRHEGDRQKSDQEKDDELFRQAMDGVKPMERSASAMVRKKRAALRRFPVGEDRESLSKLTALVEGGAGFIVSDTPEYMEGTGYGVPVEFARRLHRGDFSIQAHIDLHGLTAGDAKEIFDGFLSESIGAGKRAVLVVHGRGLSSSAEPVLKNKVREWLTSRFWRKWIIAFASAQAFDGGAGATYVLLRHRPAARRAK